MKLSFILTLLVTNTCFSQNKSQSSTDSLITKEKIPIPKNKKNSVAKFYIINDKPVSYEDYATFLLKKEEEEVIKKIPNQIKK